MKDADMKQLALYHNVMGAGKSKKKRVFKGLTEAEKIRLAKFAGEEFLSRLKGILLINEGPITARPLLNRLVFNQR